MADTARMDVHIGEASETRVRLDGAKDFISLRKETFGFELAPLPRSLLLSVADSRLNGVSEPSVGAKLPQAATLPLGRQFAAPVSRILHEVEG